MRSSSECKQNSNLNRRRVVKRMILRKKSQKNVILAAHAVRMGLLAYWQSEFRVESISLWVDSSSIFRGIGYLVKVYK
jgi:hypothetical protein